MTGDDRVFGHRPAGTVREHVIVLYTDWDTDEPQHLVCEECGVHWSVGPRIAGIPLRVTIEEVEGPASGCRPKPPPNSTP